MSTDASTTVLPFSLRDWQVCPVCRGELVTEIEEPGAQPHLLCVGACGRPWFANPKPTVSFLLTHPRTDEILLARRARDPFKGFWDIPGGFMEEGEEAEEAGRREIREETGLEVELGAFIGAFGDTYGVAGTHHTLNLFWEAQVVDPAAATPGSDIEAVRWFKRTELPPRANTAFYSVQAALDKWLLANNLPALQ